MRLFVAGVRKLLRRPASWITLLFLIAITALVYLATGATANSVQEPGARLAVAALLTFPAAYRAVLGFLLGLGGLLAVIYGAAISGSEWSWGTFKSAVARGESRSRYLLLTFASVAVLLAVGLLIAYLIGVGLAVAGAFLAGISLDGLSDAATLQGLPELLVRGWFGLLLSGAIGFAVATLTRSQLAGIAIGIGLYFGEQFSALLLPDIVRYLPFNAASALIAVRGPEGQAAQALTHALDPNAAALVVAAWLLGALAVTAAAAEIAEIGG
jgi:ABC-2 type transport system permease protein